MEHFITEIKKQIDALLLEKELILVAIAGPCTSGKTTLASHLAEIYDCNVFHMDDFFLRPEQRTPERFAEIGGNVDYERFQEEVLAPLKERLPFCYRRFDCSTFTFSTPIPITPKQLNIIEGTYGHHPYFRNPYDLKVMLNVSPELQRKRVLQRPAFLHKWFFEEWIPMENRYFAQDGKHPDIPVCLRVVIANPHAY